MASFCCYWTIYKEGASSHTNINFLSNLWQKRTDFPAHFFLFVSKTTRNLIFHLKQTSAHYFTMIKKHNHSPPRSFFEREKPPEFSPWHNKNFPVKLYMVRLEPLIEIELLAGRLCHSFYRPLLHSSHRRHWKSHCLKQKNMISGWFSSNKFLPVHSRRRLEISCPFPRLDVPLWPQKTRLKWVLNRLV